MRGLGSGSGGGGWWGGGICELQAVHGSHAAILKVVHGYLLHQTLASYMPVIQVTYGYY